MARGNLQPVHLSLVAVLNISKIVVPSALKDPRCVDLDNRVIYRFIGGKEPDEESERDLTNSKH